MVVAVVNVLISQIFKSTPAAFFNVFGHSCFGSSVYGCSYPNENPKHLGSCSRLKQPVCFNLFQLPSLFDGCNFFFSGDFKPPCVPKDELIQMVKSGGGKILSREPKPDFDVSRDVGRLTTAPTVVYHARPDSDQYRRTEYVIFDPLSGRRSRVRKYSDAVSSAPVSWLMDCISHFEIVDVPRC